MDVVQLLTEALRILVAVAIFGSALVASLSAGAFAPGPWRGLLPAAAGLALVAQLAMTIVIHGGIGPQMVFTATSYVMMLAEAGIVAALFMLPVRPGARS